MKVVDFQLASKGADVLPGIGFLWLQAQGQPTDVRAGRDEALVREYLEVLSPAHGVDDYPFDEAWRHYRFAVAYFVVLPAMSLLSWDTLAGQSRQLCMRLVDRAVAAIDEIDALEVFA